MRAICFCLVLASVPGFWTAAMAQQEAAPNSEDGPMAAHAAVTSTPQADSDGVYQPGPDVFLPSVLNGVAAAYPAEASANDPAHICLFSAVVGADGELRKIRLVRSGGDTYDQAALEAVKQSTFVPGLVHGNAVPVQIQIRVPFVLRRLALPRVVGLRSGMGGGNGADADGVIRPKPIFTKEAEFSEEARKKRISGIVVVSLTVSSEGLPTNLKVVSGVGYGMDEKALEAVRQYRFEPAMKGNTPVAMPITVEVSFKLF